MALRVLPALAGTALVTVFYLLVRELTASRQVATFGTALLLLDNAILVESRLLLIDSMLLLFFSRNNETPPQPEASSLRR